ncbi:uncharacterized protein LOC141538006 [Cotesia typhae]|uniref:uncharacterized protein LOC141538006 n=1 Tax=Cotesia typhae TaxID=2053667 RepID=UPI003D696B05
MSRKNLVFDENLNFEKIKQLIEKRGVDINATVTYCEEKGWTFLHIAADTSNEELLDYLLDNKANLNFNSENWGTPLHIAVTRDNMRVVEKLIDHGADLNSRKGSYLWTPLHVAIEAVREEAAKLLVRKGADVNLPCDDAIRTGCTPFHVAIETNREKLIKFLLKNKADVNTKLKLFSWPIFSATTLGNPKIVRSLIDHGASINLPVDDQDSPYFSFTPLHIAATFKHSKVVRVLLDYDVDIDAVTNQGDTALHLALLRPNEAVVKQLLIAGINVNILNNENKIAINYCNEDSIFKLVKEYIVKLKAAKVWIHTKNINIILKDTELKELWKKCLEEIESMKAAKIGAVTFFDVLNDHGRELKVYTENSKDVAAVLDAGIGKMFPLYADILESHLKGKYRGKMIKYE